MSPFCLTPFIFREVIVCSRLEFFFLSSAKRLKSREGSSSNSCFVSREMKRSGVSRLPTARIRSARASDNPARTSRATRRPSQNQLPTATVTSDLSTSPHNIPRPFRRRLGISECRELPHRFGYKRAALFLDKVVLWEVLGPSTVFDRYTTVSTPSANNPWS